MTGHLDLWTVYDHPKDYPDVFIARRSEIRSSTGGGAVMTGDIVTAHTLQEVRLNLRNRGLVCLARQPEDDAVIVEIWL